MKPLAIIAIAVAALAAFATISTALAHLFAALKMPRAQKVAERVGIILYAVEKTVEDVEKAAPTGPIAMGTAALKDLDDLVAAVDPSGKGTLLVARAKTMAKALGVTGLVLVMGLLVTGCGVADGVVHVVQLSSTGLVVAEPCLVQAYKLEQQACVDDHKGDVASAKDCVGKVRARYKPIADGLGELRDERCKLEPQKCAAPEGK